MMLFQNLISMDCIKHGVQCSSKKRAFELVAEIVANSIGCDVTPLFESLICREQKGNTAVGAGVAIPHARISDDEQPIAVLLQCSEAINYDALDKQPVDIIFALFIPEQMCSSFKESFTTLHNIFKDKSFLKQLRWAESEEALFDLLIAQDEIIQNLLIAPKEQEGQETTAKNQEHIDNGHNT